jgi:hypothetical protein
MNINTITSEHIFNKNTKKEPIDITKKIIKYCKSIEDNIENDISSDNLLKLLYIVDYFYKTIGLMLIVSSDKRYEECDFEIQNYTQQLFSNEKIYKKIKKMKKIETTKLLNSIEKNFYELKNPNLNKIYNDMSMLKNKIELKLDEPIFMENNKYIENIINNNDKNFMMTTEIFNLLQKKLTKIPIRNTIMTFYINKSNAVLDDFAMLLLYRNKYAKLLGHTTYFNYIKQSGPVELVTNLIDDLLCKIESRSRKETEKIQKRLLNDGINRKVEQNDFSYYVEKLQPTQLFKPSSVIKLLFEISESYFGLSFKPVKYELNLWTEKIVTCKVMKNEYEYGYVHFDFYKRELKKVVNPICVKISGSPIRLCFLSSFNDLNSECLTYNDIKLLFNEFGCLIQMITHNKEEVIAKNDDLDNLMCQVMEYILCEKIIVEKLCHSYDPIVVEQIMALKYINHINSIKIKCINSLFDHSIHNSKELINIIRENTKNNQGSNEIVRELYIKIYSDMWIEQQDIFNINPININPSIILQELNGSETKLYYNILTEILSFSVYTLIKNGHGKDFIDNVLSQKTHNMKNSLNKFIEILKTDNYVLYLQQIIGIENDNSNSDSESESDSIVIVNKIK